MIGLVVLIIMISCVIYWLVHTGALLKIHEALKKVTNAHFLYMGLMMILLAKMADVISGMELLPGGPSELSNRIREGRELLSAGLLYLGMGFVVFSFVMKLLQGKKETNSLP